MPTVRVGLPELHLVRVQRVQGPVRRDQVRARTIILKLKLARPLGGGRYPMLTRSFSLERATDDGAKITSVAVGLLTKVGGRARSLE